MGGISGAPFMTRYQRGMGGLSFAVANERFPRPTNKHVILSERSESKDLWLLVLRRHPERSLARTLRQTQQKALRLSVLRRERGASAPGLSRIFDTSIGVSIGDDRC